MPQYTFMNGTPDTAWVRAYDAAKYLLRSKNYDPHYASFTANPNLNTGYTDGRREVVFKIVLLAHPNLDSANIAFSKRNNFDDRLWLNYPIGITVSIDNVRNRVSAQ